MNSTRRRFIRDAATGLMIPFMAGKLVRAASIIPFKTSMRTVVSSGGISAPTDISGMQLWLDPNDSTKIYKETSLSTQVSADADVINGWKDKSGNANDWLATTQTTTQCVWKTNIRNGRSVVRFNGTASQFSKTMGSLGAHTVAIVLKSASTANNYGSLIINNGSTNGFVAKSYSVVPDYSFNLYSGGDHESSRNANNAWSFFYAEISGAAGAYSMYLNNVLQAPGGTVFNSIVYDRIGGHGSEYFNGDIGDVMIWNKVFTSTERGNLYTLMSSEWGGFP